MISLCHYKTKLILLMMNFFCRWAGSRKRKVQSHLRRTRPNVCRDVRLLNENDQPIPISSITTLFLPIPSYFSFYWKKIVWKFFQSTTALQHKFTPYFYSSKNSVTLVVTYYNISWKQPPPKLLLRKKNLFTSVTVVTFLRRYVPIQEARRKNTKNQYFSDPF